MRHFLSLAVLWIAVLAGLASGEEIFGPQTAMTEAPEPRIDPWLRSAARETLCGD